MWILGMAILGILYILSPLDVIPDVIPIFGWLDDLGVAGWLIKSILFAPHRHIALWTLIIPGVVFGLVHMLSGLIGPFPIWYAVLPAVAFMIFGFYKIGRELN